MEFKLKNINTSQPVLIQCFEVDNNNFAFILDHNGKRYNTLMDDVMYIYGSIAHTVSASTLDMFTRNPYLFMNQSGIKLNVRSGGGINSDFVNRLPQQYRKYTIYY